MLWTHRKPQLLLGTYGPLGLLKCRMPLESFDTRLHVVGKTKKAKSKFLEHIACQLISLGQGCGLLDSHSDLADDLLTTLASHLKNETARRQLVYFEPSRDDYLVPLNVLSTPTKPAAQPKKCWNADLTLP